MSSDSEAEFDDKNDDESSSDEDVPIASLKTASTPNGNNKRKVSPSTEKAINDDEDEEDNIPLAALAKKKTTKAPSKPTSAQATKKKTASASPKKKKIKTIQKKESASSTYSSNKKYEWSSAALYGMDSTKGMLIQRYLCRWWYASDWPQNIQTESPKNYDAMDGFPGVFVGTSGEVNGKILDTRDKATAPSFANLSLKTSEELQKLLIAALTEQKRQLVEVEGVGTPTEKELDDLLRWANKVKPVKADSEAAKIYKAHGFKH